MIFKKNTFRNHRYNEWNPNFYEMRFVYALKMPEAVEIKGLPTEYVRGQDILENRIRALDEELKIAEKRDRAKKALGASAHEVQSFKIIRDMCRAKLEQLKSSVNTPEDFRSAIDDINSYNRALSVLRTTAVDQTDIENFVGGGSEFGMFFSENLIKRLEEAETRMTIKERTANVIMPQKTDPAIARQAEADWNETEIKLQADLKVSEFNKNESENEIGALKLKLKKANERAQELKGNEIVDINEVRNAIQETRDIQERITKLKDKVRKMEDWIFKINASLGNKIKEINRRIDRLEAERALSSEKRENLAFLNTPEANELDEDMRSRILWQAESPKADKERVHKLTRQHELWNTILVGNMLSDDDRLELTNLILEARDITEARVLEYLEARFKEASGRFEEVRAKKPRRFNDISERQIKQVLDFSAKNILKNPKLFRDGESIEILTFENKKKPWACGPEAVMTVLENFEGVIDRINAVESETGGMLERRTAEPAAFKAEIERKYENVKSVMQEFTPQRVDELLVALDKQENARIEGLDFEDKAKPFNQPGMSPDYIKTRTALLELKDDGSRLKEQLKEVDGLMQRVDEMDPEELADTLTTLDRFQEVLLKVSGDKLDQALGLKNRPDAMIARHVIDLIKFETDPEKIKKILSDNLGEHCKLISDDEFTHYVSAEGKEPQNLKDYTNGSMVFYERGDIWMIIINEDDLLDGERFQSHLTHELFHLEFEKNDELKAKWKELFTNSPEWENIKSVFAASFPDKKPPAGGSWLDNDLPPEDILSEIYAMQNSFMNKEDERFASLLMAIPTDILAKALGVDKELIDRYKSADTAKDVIEKFRGSEEAEHGGGGGGHDEHGGGEEEGHGAAAESGGGNYKSFKENIEKNNGEIVRILNSEYVQYMPGSPAILNMMKDFNDETAKLNEEFKNVQSLFVNNSLKERIEQVQKDLAEIEKKISDVSENLTNTSMNPLRDIWNRTSFLALDDIFQTCKDFKEWMERRHTRRRADHAARIGTALFHKMPLPIIGEFGSEAEARQLKAEEAEVHEWKERLAEKDAWELEHMINELAEAVDPNKDMFKAILRVLADKGRINWRNPKLWKLLNKLQRGAPLPEGDDSLLKNPILLRQRLHKALGAIWDYDFYLTLERTNGSNYGEGKKKYFGGFDKIQDQLTQRLEMLLKKNRDHEPVDPQEFEGIIQYSIEKGKCSAEDCMFYLIVGVAEGILYADRPLALDGEWMNNWPALQWIYHQRPPLTKKEYIRIAKENFYEDQKSGHIGEKFKNFYWTEINNDELVIQRVRKGVAERKWDHDWGRAIAVLGDANTAKQFLQGRSGQQETKDTAVENAYAGALQWLEENAINPDKIDFQKLFARQISWITMADGIIDWVAYDKGANDNWARGTASLLSAVPREANMGNHPGLNVGGQRDLIRNLLEMLDPAFFKMIRDAGEARRNKEGYGMNVKNYLTGKYKTLEKELSGVTQIDHIFDRMDAIINAIVYSYSPDKFRKIIKDWRASAVPNA